MRSAIVMIGSALASANATRSGSRAIAILSGVATSQSMPVGRRPAIRHRSTVASVWPARLSTPPVR